MVQLTDLTRSYGNKQVLNIPAFSFASGQVHGIVGLNGSGKTTLLNSIYGSGRSKSAVVQYDGVTTDHTNTAFLEAENYFYPGITGSEYLALFAQENSTNQLSGVNELLLVPLDELITSYSTGTKKKLALLGALKLDRQVVLLDEPMNGLDLAAVRVLEAIVRKLASQGRTVFVTSHILGPLITTCDRIHHLEGGLIKQTFERGASEGLEAALFADLDKRTDEMFNR